MRSRQQVMGQNFLRHEPTIKKIIDAVKKRLRDDLLRGRKPKTILEIGPGTLALTKLLADIAANEQMKLVIVERDRFLEGVIRGGVPNGEIHFLDAATEKMLWLLDELAKVDGTPVMVVSNLPYSAASQILATLARRIQSITSAVVMVQKEMAQRMVAPEKNKHRGSFSLFVQGYFEPEMLFDVPPSAFTPAPQVMSTVLELVPSSRPISSRIEQPLEFERFCKNLFSQRRKMIRNSLGLSTNDELPPTFAKLGINGTERPEVLDFETVLQLYLALGGK